MKQLSCSAPEVPNRLELLQLLDDRLGEFRG